MAPRGGATVLTSRRGRARNLALPAHCPCPQSTRIARCRSSQEPPNDQHRTRCRDAVGCRDRWIGLVESVIASSTWRTLRWERRCRCVPAVRSWRGHPRRPGGRKRSTRCGGDGHPNFYNLEDDYEKHLQYRESLPAAHTAYHVERSSHSKRAVSRSAAERVMFQLLLSVRPWVQIPPSPPPRRPRLPWKY